MKLLIKPRTDAVRAAYANHGHHHAGDSGLDLFCIGSQTIKAGETAFIPLGIHTSAWNGDKNVSWLLMARSSICKTPLRLSNSVGLIDAGYRGEVKMAVDNIKNFDYTVNEGDRLCQAVAFNGEGITFELVEELNETTRGEGGFGSTENVKPTNAEPATKKLKGDDGAAAAVTSQ
eukprot:GDKH01014682.1.p1 GENE.GDKH01014682.1~~GDKH01014682.1.p1  ORF type:complete len:175 (+),score=35.51 GDKH01014682.1:140-664(+)